MKLFMGVLSLFLLFVAPAHADGPIRVGTNVWPGYEPLYLARALGQWKGAEVQLVELPSASEVIRAFRNNRLDAAALTLDEALLLRQNRIPVSIVLVMDISDGGDVVLARPEIKSFAELKGKKVGVESSALGAYVLTRALELNNMTVEDVKVVPLDIDMHERAYAQGMVDALITFEPVRTKLLSQGAGEVFTSREIPGEIVDVLVVRGVADGQKAGNLRKLVKGWFVALESLRNNPEKAADIMARRLKLTPEEVLESYSGLVLPTPERNRELLGGANPALAGVAAKLKESMVRNHLLSGKTDVTGLTDDSFIP